MTSSRHSVEQEEVMAYLDGELSVDRASVAAEHLEHCRECQSLAADFRNLSQRMMEWEVESSDPKMLTAISATLNEPEKQSAKAPSSKLPWRRPFLPKKIWSAAGATAVLLLAFAFLLTQGTRQITSPIPSGLEDRVRNGKKPTPGGGGIVADFYNGGRGQTVDGRAVPNKTEAGPLGKLTRQSSEERDDVSSETSFTPQGPMIIRTAALTVVTEQKDFENARSSMDEILKRHHGFFGELTAAAPQNGARSIKATLRVPSNELDATMADLKKLGRVESETQGGEEVTSEYIDLQARLANARHTEQRLKEIQAQRTGKLADVLKVEVEIARVRGEIEQMEAQRKSMRKQVDFATIDATLNEEYKAPLQSVAAPSTSTQFHNAFVEGYRNLADGIVGLLLFLITYGPTLLLWGAALFIVGRFVWKKIRRTTVS